MYWWMGSAMSPRPSYVSAAPFMGGRVPRSARRSAVLRIAVDGAYGDHALETAAPHGHVDRVAGLPAPESLVEFLLRPDTHPIDADDAVAAAEAGGARGPGLVEAFDDHALRRGGRVQPEPRPRAPARDAPRRDQLVLDRQERFERDGQVDVGRVTEPQRNDAHEPALLVDERAAAPRGYRRRHDERAIQHVLPRGGEAAHAFDRAGRVHELVVLVHGDGASARAGDEIARVAEARGRPWPRADQTHDGETGFEVDADELRVHQATIA